MDWARAPVVGRVGSASEMAITARSSKVILREIKDKSKTSNKRVTDCIEWAKKCTPSRVYLSGLPELGWPLVEGNIFPPARRRGPVGDFGPVKVRSKSPTGFAGLVGPREFRDMVHQAHAPRPMLLDAKPGHIRQILATSKDIKNRSIV